MRDDSKPMRFQSRVTAESYIRLIQPPNPATAIHPVMVVALRAAELSKSHGFRRREREIEHLRHLRHRRLQRRGLL